MVAQELGSIAAAWFSSVTATGFSSVATAVESNYLYSEFFVIFYPRALKQTEQVPAPMRVESPDCEVVSVRDAGRTYQVRCQQQKSLKQARILVLSARILYLSRFFFFWS